VKEGERGYSHEVFLYVRVDVGLLRYRMGWEFSCDFVFFGFFGSPTAHTVKHCILPLNTTRGRNGST